MNQNRRVFRGRAGATDSQLPKHNARRRKPQQASTKGSNKYGDAPLPNSRRGSRGNRVVVSENSNTGEHVETETDGVVESSLEQHLPLPWEAEIRHLRKRMKNVQESIQMGTEGIVNPTTYEQNVLYAVENCIQEWRSILNHYYNNSSNQDRSLIEEDTITQTPAVIVEDGAVPILSTLTPLSDSTITEDAPSIEDDIDPKTLQETSLAAFVLLQLSVQCGPLQGGSPGYFKRCGGEVAKVVLEYLNRITDDYDTDGDAGFADFADSAPGDTPASAVWEEDSEEDHEEDSEEEDQGGSYDTDKSSNNVKPNGLSPPTMTSTHQHQRACATLQFSARQTEAIAEWKRNAKKAVIANKPPSKSALKVQEGKSKKSKKKNNKSKKK